MPSDLADGPPVGFLVLFAIVLVLIVIGIVRAVLGSGGGTASRGARPPLPGDLGGQEHQRVVDQQMMQQGMTGTPPEVHGGHHHVDHTPPPTPPSS